MAHINGILPIPRSPGIKNGVPADYIKPSYYPIPYQAVIAIENCNIHQLLSWDINVAVKSIKIKLEWSLANSSSNTPISPIPKSVCNSISSYNLGFPSWSSSFANGKLSLKVEWKIIDVKPVPVIPNTPSNHLPAHSFTTPHKASHLNDSGYGSPILNTSTPATRLFNSPSPVKRRHDVYKSPPKYCKPAGENVSFTSTTTNSSSSPSIVACSSSSNTSISTSQPKPVVEGVTLSKSPSPSTSAITSNLTSTLPDPPVNDSLNDDEASIQSVADSSTQTITSSQLNPPPPPSSPLTSSENSKSVPDPHPDVDLSKIKSSEKPKYTVSDKSTEKDIILRRDPQVDPMNSKYVKKPKKMQKSGKNKFLDQKLDAGRMDIVGNCRFCGESLSSCYADFHILTCKKFDEMITTEFYEHLARLISNGDHYNIEGIVYNYCLYELHTAEYDVNEFFDLESFKLFIIEIEQFLDKRAACMLKSIGLSNPRRFNILKYP